MQFSVCSVEDQPAGWVNRLRDKGVRATYGHGRFGSYLYYARKGDDLVRFVQERNSRTNYCLNQPTNGQQEIVECMVAAGVAELKEEVHHV